MEFKQYGWHLPLGQVEYEKVWSWQRGLVKLRESGFARDTIITVEHPNVITVGKDGHEENYTGLSQAPVKVERGGDVTYHGPGQLVVYFIFNLTRRGRDLHKFMDSIQQSIIRTLGDYDIEASKGDEYTGIWVGKEKIASIGVAVQRWITFHGAAINLNTELSEFRKINPCGLKPEIMTSVKKLTNKEVALDEFTRRLIPHCHDIFETEFTGIDLDVLAEDVESQSGSNVI